MAESTRALWGRVLTDGQALPASRIEIADGRISRLEPASAPGAADLVVEDGWLAPGLIDVQVNGAGGVDLTSAADASRALEHVSRTLAQHGVTAFCPTIVSSAPELILDRLEAYRPRAIEGGATCLGAHVEGPFISHQRRGVHDPRVLRGPSREEIAGWLEVGAPTIVTLAPELPGALDAIRQLVSAGVVVSLGHSAATSLEALTGLSAGATMGTHLFNAMPPLEHRAPGLVGALLADPRAKLGIIVDGVHLDPLIVDLVVQRAGAARVMLISDALAAAGAPEGESVLGEQILISAGGTVRRRDGTLAGSALLLDGCLRTARGWLRELPLAKVVRMATQTPAEALGVRTKGRIAVGQDADFVVLDDSCRVRQTVVGGVVVPSASVEVTV